MAAQMTPRFRDLPDVDWASFADGEVATYDETADALTGEVGGAGGPTGAAGGVLSGTYPDPGFAADMATQAELDSHNDDTSFVHGVTNMADLATDAEVATAVSAHSSDTTSVHGITDTTVLATDAEVAGAVSDHSTDTSSVHGITDTTVLATDAEVAAAVSAHESDTTVHGVDTANVPSADQKAALAGTTGTPGSGNKYVTETDPALGGGGDLSDAVVLAPDTSLRNLIEPSVDGVPLTIRGNALQTNSLTLWENADMDDVASVGADGQITVQVPDESGFFMYPTGSQAAYVADAAPTTEAVSVYQWSDSYARMNVLGTGEVGFGDGTAAADTTLERTAAGELSVNGEPVVLDDDARLVGGVDQGDIDTTVATHSADTTSVHGIADTSALATDSEVATAVSDHSADTTSVHGIADTSALLTTSAAAAAYQPLDSDLTAIAALTTTSAGRALLDDADAAAQLTTLGVSTFVKTLLDDADAATARTTLGVTSGGLVPYYPVYITGKYYGYPLQGSPASAAGSMFQSRAEYVPFPVSVTNTFDRIGIEVGEGIASMTYRLGIYNYSLTTGLPGTLVLDAGTVDGSTTGEKFATISQSLTAGWYYLVVVPQGVAISTAKLYHLANLQTLGQVPIPQPTFRGTTSLLYKDSVTGALPDPAATPAVASGLLPNVMLRAA